ncbi:unnamed protein product [Blepharisma stoltei]|uniref:Peptidase S59 domain-containing protein n=1 Tax=Blepharisma stoltei TaxID=1481888 RepID=A0AAU9JH56_9CILI|nr:unnamed protein product [Blepharisma stoltei]
MYNQPTSQQWQPPTSTMSHYTNPSPQMNPFPTSNPSAFSIQNRPNTSSLYPQTSYTQSNANPFSVQTTLPYSSTAMQTSYSSGASTYSSQTTQNRYGGLGSSLSNGAPLISGEKCPVDLDGTGSVYVYHIAALAKNQQKHIDEMRYEDYKYKRNPMGMNSQPFGSSQINNPFQSNAYGSRIGTSGMTTGSFQPNTTNPFSNTGQYGNPSVSQAPYGSQPSPFSINNNTFSTTPSRLPSTGIGNYNQFGNNIAPAANPFSSNFDINQGRTTPNPFAASQPFQLASSSRISSQNPFTPSFPSNTSTSSTNMQNPYMNPYPSPQGSTSNPFMSSYQPYSPPMSSSGFFVNPPSFNPPMNSLYSQSTNSRQINPYMNSSLVPQMGALMDAFKDPHGLSWLFPDETPENVLKIHQQRKNEKNAPEAVPLIDRIAMTKKQQPSYTNSRSISDKWAPVSQSKKFELKPLKEITTNENNWREKKLEPFKIDIKPNFSNVRLEEYKDDDINCFKIIGSKKSASKLDTSNDVIIVLHEPEFIRILIPVTRTTTIYDLKSHITRQIKIPENTQIQLVYKSMVLKDSDTIIDAGIGNHEEILAALKKLSPVKQSHLVPTELLPKLNKAGYSMTPHIWDMANMTEEELSKITNFSIENQYGKIIFDGETSVLNLDINNIIEIVQNSIDVYPEKSSIEKPPIGEGLNKPAELHLYNCRPGKATSTEKFEERLHRICDKSGSEFVNWNPSTGEWVFRVQNF